MADNPNNPNNLNHFDIRDKPSDDNIRDEVINIRLPREQYEILRLLIRERQAFNYFKTRVNGLWIWAIGATVIATWTFWDKIYPFFVKV